MLGRKPRSYFNSSTLTQDLGELWQTATGKLVYISVRKKAKLLIARLKIIGRKEIQFCTSTMQLPYKYLTHTKIKRGECSTFLFFSLELNSKWKLNSFAKGKPILNTTHFFRSVFLYRYKVHF